jgi:hypothetical protein
MVASLQNGRFAAKWALRCKMGASLQNGRFAAKWASLQNARPLTPNS